MTTTGEVLKPCPFCSAQATRRKKGGFLRRMFWYPGLTKVSCSNDGCGAFFSYWSADEWNRRAPQGNAAQEGYVLVPVEPTDDMITNMCAAHEFSQFHDLVGPMTDAYAAMVEVAQQDKGKETV